ncbi:MAG TPA: sulfotransferase [Gammaproteobacteria bacterium]|nr:sulfotransferase [Gammaproteobacteria bacterium]
MQGRPPILLIFGLPRSGTTWLGKIFDSHPDTLYRHEPDNYPRLEALPRFPAPTEAERYSDFIHRFVAELPRRNDALVAAKMPLFQKSWRGRFRHRLLEAAALAAKVGAKANLEVPVVGARADKIQPTPMIVWKSIESLGRLGLLMRALPEAIAIHLVRHPCGQINSVLRGERQGAFRDNSPTSEFYDLFKKLLETPQARRHGLTLDDLRRMRPVERLAWMWVLKNEKALDDVSEVGRTRLVRYEDLCEDPMRTSRSLFDFAGLTWNGQTETFIGQSTQSDAAAYYSVYKDPRHSELRWREELPPDSIDSIAAVLDTSRLVDLYRERDSRAISTAGG